MKQKHDDFDLSNLPEGKEPTKEEIKKQIEQGKAEEVSIKDIEDEQPINQQWEFPWEDVERCRKSKRLQKKHPIPPFDTFEYPISPCPKCGTPAKELTWLYFESPKETWEHHCGKAGWLIMCDTCRVQVQFILEKMN